MEGLPNDIDEWRIDAGVYIAIPRSEQSSTPIIVRES